MGGQLTKNIARVLQESAKVRSAILDPKKAEVWLNENMPKAIILSGSGKSVREPNSPKPPERIFQLRHNGLPIPILGICYGMHYLAHHFGGKVAKEGSEYRLTNVSLTPATLFKDTPVLQELWMNHGDSVISIPPGFKSLGKSSGGVQAAMVDLNRNIWAVQFHPEATQSLHGPKMLTNFVQEAGCVRDWDPGSIVDTLSQNILDQVGSDENVVVGASGGVDSTTLIAMSSKVLGDRLRGVTFDFDQLREGELGEIGQNCRVAGLLHHVILDRREQVVIFADTTDAEEKRARFRRLYVGAFTDFGNHVGSRKILQGTIAPDLIESAATGGALIKTHHNVKLVIPGFDQLQPFEHLYKYEVRALAKLLGLPEWICNRRPFPGPGLIIRIVGIPVTTELLALLRWADFMVESIVREHFKTPEKLSQLVTYLAGIRLVGQKGESRSYGFPIVVRGIETLDFMTGLGVRFDVDIKQEIETVLPAHADIATVYWEEADKPPRTTEPE